MIMTQCRSVQDWPEHTDSDELKDRLESHIDSQRTLLDETVSSTLAQRRLRMDIVATQLQYALLCGSDYPARQ